MKLDFAWSEGDIATLADFDEVTAWLIDHAHPDGYYYPPIEHQVRGSGDDSEVVPRSRRAAFIHQVPPTHELSLDKYPPDAAAVREGLAGFVIHFLGFLVGHRTQFDDWWLDGRLKTAHGNDVVGLTQRRVKICLEHAVSSWTTVDPKTQQLLTNAFYMHNRAPVYAWPWERFVVEYQVFDALFRVASNVHGVRATKKRPQFEALVDRYGLFHDAERMRRIVELRNELFHEALWVGGTPGTGGGEDGFYVPVWLRHINERLGLAVLGFTGPYISSSWMSLVTRFLDLDGLAAPRSA